MNSTDGDGNTFGYTRHYLVALGIKEVSVWDSITEHYNLDGLNSKHLLQFWRPEVQDQGTDIFSVRWESTSWFIDIA